MIASTQMSQIDKLREALESAPDISQINFIEQVSTKTPYTHTDSVFDFASFSFAKPQSLKAKIIAIDFGAKANILNELTFAGLEVEVMPHTFKADEIVERFKKGEIQGVFLSNGPGDPLVLCNIQKAIVADKASKLVNDSLSSSTPQSLK